MDYKFRDPPITACIVCSHVINDNEPIEYVTHDDEDGVWQFICGREEHDETHIKTRPLEHITDLDPDVNSIANLKLGQTARRNLETKEWSILDFNNDEVL